MGDPSHSASAARMVGYRQAFAAAGVSIDESLIVRGDFTYDKGHEAALILLSRRPTPTAILAQNDDMAVAAMGAARASGLSVPDDLSVAGFDNSEISRTAWPQLTTVHQPVQEMAWEATNLLIAALESGDMAACRRDRRHEVLARGSTAAPAG